MQHDEIAAQIGGRARAARKRAKMTRKQLAAAASVSERYLHQLENGSANASIGILLKVADALALPFEGLLLPATISSNVEIQGQALSADLSALLAQLSPSEQEAVTPVLRRFVDERRRSQKGLALLGLRGAGKSTLGRLLADRHGLSFVSITQEIETRAGMSITDLFNLGGPDAYRGLENEVARDLATSPRRIVLETAGGIVDNAEALDIIHGAFQTVWLTASPEEHLSRVAGQGDMRPMDGNPRAIEHLRTLLSRRAADYARAQFTLDTSGRSVEESLQDLEAIAGPLIA